MPLPAPGTGFLSLATATCRRPRHTLILLRPATRLLSSSSDTRPPAYRYHAAASVSAKTDPLDLARNTYTHRYARDRRALARKPWPPRGGHDAFFLSDAPADGGGGGGGAGLALGVADGVGGWVDSGVNPADFSRRLCRHMARAAAAGVLTAEPYAGEAEEDEGDDVSTARTEQRRLLRPVELLEHGYAHVLADPGVWAGGSTACVATASPGGVVEVAKYTTPPRLATTN
jgi:protein phosphatase PTC7